jgi:hypothetical protein
MTGERSRRSEIAKQATAKTTVLRLISSLGITRGGAIGNLARFEATGIMAGIGEGEEGEVGAQVMAGAEVEAGALITLGTGIFDSGGANMFHWGPSALSAVGRTPLLLGLLQSNEFLRCRHSARILLWISLS